MKPFSQKNYQRFWEILPGFLTWLTIIAIFPLSHYAAFWVALFVLLYDLSWLIKIAHISTHLVYTFRRLRETKRVHYIDRLNDLENPQEYIQKLEKRLEEISHNPLVFFNQRLRRERFELRNALYEVTPLTGRSDVPSWKNIHHVVVIPTVKEPLSVLFATLDAIVESDFPKNRISVVMAFEERSGDEGRAKADALIHKYREKFEGFHTFFHPSNVPGELKAKSANITYAMREMKKVIDLTNIPYENILVSAFDCDTQVAKEYFSCLTYHYLKHPQRTHASYQPIPLYNNNIWDVPAMARVAALGSTFWQMIEASRSQRLVTFSSHSMSMKTLVDVDFWPVNVISEDSQIFWRAYLHYNSNYEVDPMFTTVSMDATDDVTYLKAHIAQYMQKKRWFWGVENFPYIMTGFLKSPGIPFWKKFWQALRMLDSFYTLATAPIIIALGGWLPLHLGSDAFRQSVAAQNLVALTQILTTLSLVGLLTTFFLSMYLLPKRPPHKKRLSALVMVLQWILVPIITIVFGSIPAIDSQTRLMLGRPLGEFWVTEKTRK